MEKGKKVPQKKDKQTVCIVYGDWIVAKNSEEQDLIQRMVRLREKIAQYEKVTGQPL